MKPLPLARPIVGPEEVALVAEVLATGQLGPGPRVKEFETAFARLHDAAHGVACSNGTVAIEHALRAMGVGMGDEVIVPDFTFIATANAVLAVGARPVFADIDPATFTLDPADVAAAITPRTKAVIPVHLYGCPANLHAIREAIGEVLILEDAAQAHLALHRGKPVGALGAAGTFSFYPTKNMTTGEGGVVLTNDEALASGVRSAINHGRAPGAALGTYDHAGWGTNARMSDVHAAIGLAQLRHLEAWTAKRRENAQRLTKGLQDVVVTPVERPGDRHVYHQYTVLVPDRDRVVAKLREEGVGTGVYYPRPLSSYPHLAHGARRCPEAQRAAREVLSLPVHPSLTPQDVDRVVASLRKAVVG